MRNRLLTAMAIAAMATAALASVTFDPPTGKGFVGKGDVQLTFGWNNATLQRNAGGVGFQTSRTFVTDTTWTCGNAAGTVTYERTRTTTLEIQHLLDSIGRLKSQITGFNLLGYASPASFTVVAVEGPLIEGSCPVGVLLDGPTSQITDPGTLQLQVQSTGPNPFDWTNIVVAPATP